MTTITQAQIDAASLAVTNAQANYDTVNASCTKIIQSNQSAITTAQQILNNSRLSLTAIQANYTVQQASIPVT